MLAFFCQNRIIIDGLYINIINMPKKMEATLKRKAKKMGLGKKRTGAYVYGTMRKAGWKPKKKR